MPDKALFQGSGLQHAEGTKGSSGVLNLPGAATENGDAPATGVPSLFAAILAATQAPLALPEYAPQAAATAGGAPSHAEGTAAHALTATAPAPGPRRPAAFVAPPHQPPPPAAPASPAATHEGAAAPAADAALRDAHVERLKAPSTILKAPAPAPTDVALSTKQARPTMSSSAAEPARPAEALPPPGSSAPAAAERKTAHASPPKGHVVLKQAALEMPLPQAGSAHNGASPSAAGRRSARQPSPTLSPLHPLQAPSSLPNASRKSFLAAPSLPEVPPDRAAGRAPAHRNASSPARAGTSPTPTAAPVLPEATRARPSSAAPPSEAAPATMTPGETAQATKATGHQAFDEAILLAPQDAAESPRPPLRSGRFSLDAHTSSDQGQPQHGAQRNHDGETPAQEKQRVFVSHVSQQPEDAARSAMKRPEQALPAPPPDAISDSPPSPLADLASSEASARPAEADIETHAPSGTRRPLPPAWVQSLTKGPFRSLTLANGWKMLEMQLEEGAGKLTIKARRQDDGMAVTVGFTDPNLSALATANAQQIQEALQVQYGTAVDFSLMGEQADQQRGHASAEADGGAPSTDSTSTTDEDDAPPLRTTLPDGRHEWVG